MNILFFNDNPFNPCLGGIERVTDSITKGLLASFDCYKIFYMFCKVSNSEILNYNFPVKTFELPFDNGFEAEENIDFFLNVLKEYKIDIIINQRGGCSWTNKAMRLAKSVKIISVVHSLVDYNIYRILYEHQNFYKKSLLGILKYKIKNFFPCLLKKYVRTLVVPEIKFHYNELLNYSDAVVLLSSRYIKDLKSYVDVSKSMIYSIPNPNTFAFQQVEFADKKKEILYVGRLDPIEKAPMRLLHIWRKLYKKHEDWKLIIVGDGEEKNKMIAYVNRYNLPRVIFEGSQRDVSIYYKNASIVCITSNFEGFSMTLTEGMSYGCVPFTFNNFGAAYDIIDSGINGFLIKSYNIDEYSTQLSKIMYDKQKIVMMGKSAIEKTKQFSVESVVDKWHELFTDLYAELSFD